MEITEKLEEQLKEKMGTWYPVLKEYVKTDGFTEIIGNLKKLSSQGKKLAPKSEDLWNAYKYCPRDKFRILMLGLCPYHTFKDKECVADGVMFSCSKTSKMEQQQPSLTAVYNGMEEDLYKGFNVHHPRKNDLKYLCKQSILMINSHMTVEGVMAQHRQMVAMLRIMEVAVEVREYLEKVEMVIKVYG